MAQLDGDLCWYFQESAGALGLRASPLEPSIGGSTDDGVSERQLESAGRHRLIADALHSLPAEMVRSLRIAHVPLPPALRIKHADLGEHAALVVHLADDPARLATMVHDANTSKDKARREAARGYLAALKAKAEAAVRMSIRAYRDERKRAEAQGKEAAARRNEALISELLDGPQWRTVRTLRAVHES